MADELVDGYFDGLSDERDELPAETNRSDLYRFGWLNGRDDRKQNPRKTAQAMRDELAKLRTPRDD